MREHHKFLKPKGVKNMNSSEKHLNNRALRFTPRSRRLVDHKQDALKILLVNLVPLQSSITRTDDQLLNVLEGFESCQFNRNLNKPTIKTSSCTILSSECPEPRTEGQICENLRCMDSTMSTVAVCLRSLRVRTAEEKNIPRPSRELMSCKKTQ